MRLRSACAGLATAAVLLSSCGDGDGATTSGSGGGKLDIVASFYPLQYTAERVAGDLAEVRSLTKPGAEPHDLELSPRDVGAVAAGDLVVYVSGFQPAVDEAVTGEAKDHALDATTQANLDLTYTAIEDGEAAADEAGSTDPHFWLDPTRLEAVAAALAERLGTIDPTHAQQFRDNAAGLAADLHLLDNEFRAGLTACANKDMVTSHNAFGYLARRYGLEQVGITGLTPDNEPSPRDLASVTDFVKQHDVHTIYYETLVSPAIAETVAKETGARTAVLDPIEGLSDESQGKDYLQVMRSNLRNLQEGQPCR